MSDQIITLPIYIGVPAEPFLSGPLSVKARGILATLWVAGARESALTPKEIGELTDTTPDERREIFEELITKGWLVQRRGENGQLTYEAVSSKGYNLPTKTIPATKAKAATRKKQPKITEYYESDIIRELEREVVLLYGYLYPLAPYQFKKVIEMANWFEVNKVEPETLREFRAYLTRINGKHNNTLQSWTIQEAFKAYLKHIAKQPAQERTVFRADDLVRH
jgi:hypothetical protein